MDATQNAAYLAFLRTLTPAQRTALMDVLSMHVENVDADGDPEDPPAEHEFIQALDTATVFAVVADTPAAATV